MPARSIASGAITFGLVTIPVRIHPAIAVSSGLTFHWLHRKDLVRLKQQYVCPEDEEVVPRSEMVKGYEYAKGRYVTFTPEELKALDEQSTQGIEIAEFLPEGAVEPIYYERAYYLGPDKGGENAYALLGAAMKEMGRVAVAKYAARGKDYLVLLRPQQGRLVMHQLYHSDEVRPASEVPAGGRAPAPAELKLARQLIEQVTGEEFKPSRYEDQVRKRVRELIARKVKGEDITAVKAARPKAKVIDLMSALKASLAGSGGHRRAPQAAHRTQVTRKATARQRRAG